MTGKAARAPAAHSAAAREAALTFARLLVTHLHDGLASGRLATVLSGAACLEHYSLLVGPGLAGECFAQACRERQGRQELAL